MTLYYVLSFLRIVVAALSCPVHVTILSEFGIFLPGKRILQFFLLCITTELAIKSYVVMRLRLGGAVCQVMEVKHALAPLTR